MKKAVYDPLEDEPLDPGARPEPGAQPEPAAPRPLALSALRLVCDAISLATAMACIVVGVLHFAPSVREWVQSFIWWGLF